jgi:hypothetical protein
MYGWRMRQSVTFVTTMKNNSGEPSIYRGPGHVNVLEGHRFIVARH